MFAMILSSAAANAADVEVHIHGVASTKGFIMVALCDEAEFLKTCAREARTPATRGDAGVAFLDVPAGRWAVMAYHDENGNGRLDKNVLGVPTEGTAFSRDAKGHFGPPSFNDAAFSAGAGKTVLDVKLSY
jgi:uncharacterized protein (DUF2141 family)